jgi:hypothetical protein
MKPFNNEADNQCCYLQKPEKITKKLIISSKVFLKATGRAKEREFVVKVMAINHSFVKE